MKSRRSKITTLLFLLPLLTIAAFYACSSSGGTDSVTPASGSTITTNEKIVLTFANEIDPDSLELKGNVAESSDGGVWSADHKTLTISPSDYWDLTSLGSLTVNAKDAGGTAIATVELKYSVGITLDKFQKAKVVIGAATFTENPGGTTSTTFTSPYANAGYGNGKLILPDYSNNRTLIFNKIPTANGKPANVVVGQPGFVTNSSALSSIGSGGPVSTQVYQDKLFVLDYGYDRLLIYNKIPEDNGKPANVVVGQTAMNLSTSTCNTKNFDSPESFWIVNGKLIVADSSHNRVLIWNEIPETNGKAADIVLGQDSFTTCMSNDDDQDGMSDSNPSSRTLNFPTGVWSDGTKLVIGDESNSRILIWNSFPTENFAKADLVLGQSNFSKDASNDDDQEGSDDGHPSSRTLSDPYVGIASNGKNLIVTDSGNNRVLIWNTFPTENFAKADVVLGQESFVKQTANDDDQDNTSDGNPSARIFSYPAGVLLVGDQLIVTDEGNSRYLIFNGQ